MLFKRNFKGKSAPKCKKELLPKHHPPVTVMQPLQCDLRFSGAKDNISTTQPQQREAFKQPPDYDLQRLGKTHYSKASTTKNKKSPGSLTSNASAIQNSFNSKTRRASEPTFLRNETSVYPKKSKKKPLFRPNLNLKKLSSGVKQFHSSTATCDD